MSSFERVLAWGIGFILLGGIGWLLRAQMRSQAAPSPDAGVEAELRRQLAEREAALAALRTEGLSASNRAAGAEAARSAAETQLTARTEEAALARREASETRDRLAAVEVTLATARQEVEMGRVLLEEQRRFHADNERELREKHDAALAELRTTNDRALAALRDQFKALASEALSANTPDFLRLANETFAKFQASGSGDLAQRQEGVAALVKPLEEQLKAYQQRLQQAEAQQGDALGKVKQQLQELAAQSQSLSSETQRLRMVLSSNQARGRWGEETLRRVVEAAGLSAHCDFVEQVKEGESKPDMIVRLPGNRMILVDSKVPDLDFLGALGEADTVRRAETLALHARKLRDTVKALADRDYPRQFPDALDHVVLFLPAESLFSAALEGDSELLIWAAERRILLTTPASLIALLRSVSVSWQQHEQSQNAREIAAAARELYERVVTFSGHFSHIRGGLERAVKSYNDAVGSFESRVRPGGEKLIKLGGGTETKSLGEAAPLDLTLRLPPAS